MKSSETAAPNQERHYQHVHTKKPVKHNFQKKTENLMIIHPLPSSVFYHGSSTNRFKKKNAENQQLDPQT